MAATAADAQAAYDAVKDEATTAESTTLMQAVADRTAALALMDRMDRQMMALSAAAADIDVTMFDLTTEAGVAVAEALVAALEDAIAMAADVDADDLAMYQRQLDAASLPVMAARAELDRLGRIDAAFLAIQAAATESEAFAAYYAVRHEATRAEADDLFFAAVERADELELMAMADSQRMAMTTAAESIDTSDLSTQAAVDAASAAIAALEAAIAAATDASAADRAVYQAMADAANAAVMTAQTALDRATQMDNLSAAVTGLSAIDLGNLTTQTAIDAANAAIDALQTAIDNATDLTNAEKAAALADLSTAKRTVLSAQGRFDVAGQMAALSAAVTALEAIDLDDLMTQARIDAANVAIKELQDALAAATDLTDAQKLDATVALTLAKRTAMAAQTTLNANIDAQEMALTTAAADLDAIDLADLSTQALIDAANAAIAALQMALDGASHLSEADKSTYQTQLDTATETVRTAETGMARAERIAMQRSALSDAMMAAQMAVNMVDDMAGDDVVTAADDALDALQKAIDDAVDLPAGDIDVATAQGALTALKSSLMAAKDRRDNAMAEAERQENEARALTAARLYQGISVPSGDVGSPSVTDRAAAYNDSDTAILVSRGDGTAAILSRDRTTAVADNHGWEGRRYTRTTPKSEGTYEAFVYSNIEEPEMGRKFGNALPGSGEDRPFEYMLNPDGNLTAAEADGVGATTDAFVSSRVEFRDVARTAGTETFELPDPNPTQQMVIAIPGSYHGVPGTYNCDPGGTTTSCSASVVSTDSTGTQFMLSTAGGDAWTFTPDDPNANVRDMVDTDYASYGWWLHITENGETYTASAFTDEKGTVDAAAGIDALNGTATYMGGAAGKYALTSTTGGTNDAGHFTARAMLEADFTNNEDSTAITGTIDMFIGADGMSRDWSVKLNASDIGDDGGIGNAGDGTDPVTTVWTIGDTASDPDGQWTGALRDTGEDLVPKVATGTFYSTYGTAGNDGRMIGGFGANVQ